MSFICKDCGKEFYPKFNCTCLGQLKKPAESHDGILLIDIFQQIGGICEKCYGGENCKYNDVLQDCPIYQKLVAHDQQVAKKVVKEFAEKCIKDFETGNHIAQSEWETGYQNGLRDAAKAIEEMANEE